MIAFAADAPFLHDAAQRKEAQIAEGKTSAIRARKHKTTQTHTNTQTGTYIHAYQKYTNTHIRTHTHSHAHAHTHTHTHTHLSFKSRSVRTSRPSVTMNAFMTYGDSASSSHLAASAVRGLICAREYIHTVVMSSLQAEHQPNDATEDKARAQQGQRLQSVRS
jgi:hypothetical protein